MNLKDKTSDADELPRAGSSGMPSGTFGSLAFRASNVISGEISMASLKPKSSSTASTSSSITRNSSNIGLLHDNSKDEAQISAMQKMSPAILEYGALFDKNQASINREMAFMSNNNSQLLKNMQQKMLAEESLRKNFFAAHNRLPCIPSLTSFPLSDATLKLLRSASASSAASSFSSSLAPDLSQRSSTNPFFATSMAQSGLLPTMRRPHNIRSAHPFDLSFFPNSLQAATEVARSNRFSLGRDPSDFGFPLAFDPRRQENSPHDFSKQTDPFPPQRKSPPRPVDHNSFSAMNLDLLLGIKRKQNGQRKSFADFASELEDPHQSQQPHQSHQSQKSRATNEREESKQLNKKTTEERGIEEHPEPFGKTKNESFPRKNSKLSFGNTESSFQMEREQNINAYSEKVEKSFQTTENTDFPQKRAKLDQEEFKKKFDRLIQRDLERNSVNDLGGSFKDVLFKPDENSVADLITAIRPVVGEEKTRANNQTPDHNIDEEKAALSAESTASAENAEKNDDTNSQNTETTETKEVGSKSEREAKPAGRQNDFDFSEKRSNFSAFKNVFALLKGGIIPELKGRAMQEISESCSFSYDQIEMLVRQGLNYWNKKNLESADLFFGKAVMMLFAKCNKNPDAEVFHLFTIAKIIHNRGLIARQKSLYFNARKHFSRSFMIFLKLGVEKPDIFTILTSSAQLYMSEGQLKYAAAPLIKALNNYKQHYSSESYIVCCTLIDLFFLNFKMGKLKTAAECAETALRNMNGMVYKNDAMILQLKSSLSKVYEKLGMFDKAYKINIELLSTLEHKYGKKNPSVIKHVLIIARQLEAHSEFAKAETLYNRCIENFNAHYKYESLEVASIKSCLAGVYICQGKVKEALKSVLESLSIRKKYLIELHPILGDTYLKLATIHWACAHFIEAENFMNIAAETFTKSLGPVHETTIQTKMMLRNIRQKQPVMMIKPF